MIYALKRDWLRAAALFAQHPRQLTHTYLAGVLVEFNYRGLFMVATDGHRMLVLHEPVEGGLGDSRFVLPFNVLPRAKDDEMQVFDSDASTLGGRRCKLIDATHYPQWRSIMPAPNGCQSQFNSRYLADLYAAGRLLDERRANVLDFGQYLIDHNGTSGALVRWYGCPAALGVIMPMRTADIHDRPDWG